VHCGRLPQLATRRLGRARALQPAHAPVTASGGSHTHT
jgi:hypothetical protein